MASRKNIVAATAILVIAVALFALSFTVESSTMTTIGPEFMPRILAGVLFALGILDLKMAVRDYNTLKKQGESRPPPAAGKRPSFLEWCLDNLDWVSGALMLGYVVCISRFGFLIPSVVYMFLQTLLYTTNQKRNYPLYIVISVVVPAVIYFGFRNYFYLMLPAGILG